MNILIAEDEQDIRELIGIHLSKENFKLFMAEDGEQALNIFKENKIDLALLDIMMPKIDGFSLVKKIREINDIPIILLTARGEDADKILGFGIGADDYIVKPFNPVELIARINAQLRRCYKYSNGNKDCNENLIIKIGDITIDKESYSVYKGDSLLEVNAKEYKILQFLMENAGKVFTKKQLYETVWEDTYYGDDNTIMVHISHLRDKIEDIPKNPSYLKTIRGIGYKFEKV